MSNINPVPTRAPRSSQPNSEQLKKLDIAEPNVKAHTQGLSRLKYPAVQKMLLARPAMKLNLAGRDMRKFDLPEFINALNDFVSDKVITFNVPKDLVSRLTDILSGNFSSTVEQSTPQYHLDYSQLFRGANLSAADCSMAKLNVDPEILTYLDVVFRQANFEAANLEDSRFENCDFGAANLARAKLNSSILHQCNLEKADLTSAKLNGTEISNIELDRTNFSKAQLNGANFSNGTSLKNVFAMNAHLQGANLSNTEINGGNFMHANLRGADLRAARLKDIDLSCANLRGASITDAKFENVRVSGDQQRSMGLTKAQRDGTY